MHSPCQFLDKYMNLLKPLSVIGKEFTQELRVQQQVLALVRQFGISRTLTLISIVGETARLIQKEAKEKSYTQKTLLGVR